MADDLASHFDDLYDRLGDLPAKEFVPWQVAQVFNALLAAAQDGDRVDPVTSAIQPAEQSMLGPVANLDVASMRTSIALLRGALEAA